MQGVLPLPLVQPNAPQTPHVSRWKRTRAFLAAALMVGMGLFLWAALIALPSHVAANDLDQSWEQVLGFFLARGSQAGSDYVFTFGPLGYFTTTVYNADLYWARYAWELVVKGLIAINLMTLLAMVRSASLRWLLFAGIFLFLPFSAEPLYYCGVLSAAALLLVRPSAPWPLTVLRVALLVALSLMKGTFFAPAVLFVLLAEARWRWLSPRIYVSPLPLFVSFFVAGWVLLGQSVGNLPKYFQGLAQMITGYSAAMATYGSPTELGLAAAFGLVYSVIVIRLFLRSRARGGSLFFALFLAAGIFFLWKAGFTRHDSRHAVTFFASTAVLTLLLAVFQPGHGRGVRVVICYLFGIGAVGSLLIGSPWDRGRYDELLLRCCSRPLEQVRTFLSPQQHRANLEAQQAQSRDVWDLPRVRQEVGDDTIDMVSCAQGVLLLNRLNYHSRPVFQSYVAFTPALARLNRDWFESPEAPQYVLVKLGPIDERFPMLEDALCWRTILWRYHPVLVEKTYTLLKKNESAEPESSPGESVVLERAVPFSEPVDLTPLAGQYLFLSLRFKETLLGKLRGLLCKPQPLYIVVETNTREHFTYRVIAGMATDGFLLTPLVQSTPDLLRLYGPPNGPQVRSFKLLTEGSPGQWYEDKIDVKIASVAALIRTPCEPEWLDSLLYPMFRPAPTSVTSPLPSDWEIIDGHEVLRLPARGEIHFAVAPNAKSVSACFGVLPQAYDPGTTDGMLMQIELIGEKGQRTLLFERHLDPRATPQDRGTKSVRLDLPPHGKGELVLRTTNLPGHNEHCDWSYWTDVEIK